MILSLIICKKLGLKFFDTVVGLMRSNRNTYYSFETHAVRNQYVLTVVYFKANTFERTTHCITCNSGKNYSSLSFSFTVRLRLFSSSTKQPIEYCCLFFSTFSYPCCYFCRLSLREQMPRDCRFKTVSILITAHGECTRHSMKTNGFCLRI